MTPGVHEYTARLIWDGNKGTGTATYAGYGREYRVLMSGKPDLHGTADPMFKGDAAVHNPEDLFLAAISACHMLSYLALCARQGIRVVEYEDDVQGTMKFDANGGGKFENVTLHPKVTIEGSDRSELALELHEKAHELCYIAASCSVPILHQPTLRSV